MLVSIIGLNEWLLLAKVSALINCKPAGEEMGRSPKERKGLYSAHSGVDRRKNRMDWSGPRQGCYCHSALSLVLKGVWGCLGTSTEFF